MSNCGGSVGNAFFWCEPLESRRLFAAGDLDVAFGGGDGIIDLPAGLGTAGGAHVRSIAALPDDRLVVLGGPVAGHTLSIARLTAAGALDATFGTAGRAGFTLDAAANVERAEAILVQPDGKILVGAWAGAEKHLVRFNANGTLDTTFGNGGVLPLGTLDGHVETIAFQPDGKILIAEAVRLYRFNVDGSPDAAFGVNGSVAHPLGLDFNGETMFFGQGRVPIVLSNGRIAVVGRIESLTDGNFTPVPAVVQFSSSGDVQQSFGDDGVREITNGAQFAVPVKVIELSGGKLLVALSRAAVTPGLLVMRLNADGTPDTSFGLSGFVRDEAHVPVQTQHMSVDDDGRILLAGPTVVHGLGDGGSGPSAGGLIAIRLRADGTFGDSFGRVAIGNVDVTYPSQGFAVQSDGGLVVHAEAADHRQPGPTQPTPQLLKLAAGGAAIGPIRVVGNDHTVTITGTSEDDVIRFDNMPTVTTAFRNGIGRLLDVEMRGIDVDAGDGNDVVLVRAIGPFLPTTVVGGAGNDRISTDLADDSISGGDGYDRIDGGGGNDTLRGGDGRDWIRGQAGDDTISGAAWSDFLDGGAGNDFVFGGGFHDRLTGGPGTDTLVGSTGDDLFFSNDGEIDELFGDAGNDVATRDDDDLLTGIEG